MNRARILGSPATALVVMTLAWLVLVPLLHVNPRYLPPLPLVVGDALSVWPDLVASFWRTLVETVLGFALGASFGFLVGIGFAYVPVFERAIFPLFVASQTIPVIAFGAIVVIWFGNTILAKVMIACYLTFLPVAVNTLRGLKASDPQRRDLMRSFGASSLQLFLKLGLPTALPTVMTGLKVGVSLSLVGAIVGEWFGDTIGLGVMLLQSLYFEQAARMWVMIVVCGAMGTALYGAIVLFERLFVWWRPA